MLNQVLCLRQSVVLTLKQNFGETIGDVPVYSLHRIKNQINRIGIDISEDMKILLLQKLIEANQDYKEESGNDWSCLTSNNLVTGIENTENEAIEAIESIGKGQPRELINEVKAVQAKLHELRIASIGNIKKWFSDNYDNLLYNMDGKIPWPVIRSLRSNLSVWIMGLSNPFAGSINDAILEVAENEGIVTDDPEEAWKKMGGQIFKTKEN